MKEINSQSNIGKIYQIPGGISNEIVSKISEDSVFIQTYGPPIPTSIKCTSVYKLKNILSEHSNAIIYICTISSFCVDEEVNSWLRLAVTRGCTLYLYTFQSYKAWFADELIDE